MKRKSSRALKSVTVMTKPAKAPASGAWADRRVVFNLIGTADPATDIGIEFIGKGVSILRIYDPTPVVQFRATRSPVCVSRDCPGAPPGAGDRSPPNEDYGLPFPL